MTTISVDVTDPAPIRAVEAARGARKQRLQEIDGFWSAYREDLAAEYTAEWDAAHAAFWDRIRALTADVTVHDGALHGNPLRWQLACPRIVAALTGLGDCLWQARMRHDMAVADANQLQEKERHPFAFDLLPTACRPIATPESSEEN